MFTRLRYSNRMMQQMSKRYASVIYGKMETLPPHVRAFVEKNVKLCQPDNIHIVDGTDAEDKALKNKLVQEKVFFKLPKYENCWYAVSDPKDVARVESKTLISTPERRDTIPTPKKGVKGVVGYWLSPKELDQAVQERFPGCMKGRTMYVIPYSMGPIGSPLAKYGVQCSDSEYVVVNMRIMTRMGEKTWQHMDEGFIKCLHSVGFPLPSKEPPVNNWPCDPKKVLIAHVPADNAIISYGSGYGGNALLGKKCFALRLGSIIARKEGWMAEHMLILGLTDPKGDKKYITGAFPSQCGKTNLALMQPTLPGFKLECVGDDIAWMRFVGPELRAINPEAGFFGVAPGTSKKSNPIAMDTIFKNSIFTNTARTDDGGVFWEGLEDELKPGTKITSWLGKTDWKEKGEKSAHSNSRFTTPANQCSIMDPKWEDSAGVPVSAFLFGGRRPKGVPLVYEAFNWKHGVLLGAAMRSESTSAAEFKGKVIMHDPFAMRPFFGYNFGDYIKHWLSMEKAGRQMPRVFHINWFRTDDNGKFLWPGFGENSRVLAWIMDRLNGKDVGVETAIGYVPKPGSINLDGLKKKPNMEELFSTPKDFWLDEVQAIHKYFNEQIPEDTPEEMIKQLNIMTERIKKMA